MKVHTERTLFWATACIGLAAILWPLEIVLKRCPALSFYARNWHDGPALPWLTDLAVIGLFASLALGVISIGVALRGDFISSAANTLARRLDIAVLHLFVFVLSWADWAIALPYQKLQSVH